VVVLPFVPVIMTFFLHREFNVLKSSGLILNATLPGSAVAFIPTIFNATIVSLPAKIDGVISEIYKTSI
jgi:hypothetical protein